MVTLLATTTCNRECPYCFDMDGAGERSGRDTDQTRIPLDSAKKVIDQLVSAGKTGLTIAGGEPTLHPDLPRILDMATAAGLRIRLHTNGSFSDDVADAIDGHKVTLVFNINGPRQWDTAERERMEALLARFGERATVAHTIYREEFDLDPLFDLVDRLSLNREILVRLSQPVVRRANTAPSPKQYRKIGRRLAGYARESDRRSIRLVLGCGFVLCMFSRTELGRLFWANADIRFACEPGLDVGPDLTLSHCLPLYTLENRNLSEFESIETAYRQYLHIPRAFSLVGMFQKCNECAHLERGQCTGGCVAHKIREHPLIANDIFM
ncbi:MAG: radical SAM protein [Desulfatibacillaceae bacterium]